ncbi:hypothetical protein KMI_10g16090 [Encephalitozoon hellem]|uniref:GOLD domain-containing protein n=1 Tax=Encephalitozoon hellem TaxID=27973 RepID=A0A9Q9C6M6_ENCHE|nr:uncharacterized protein EHEL_010660 [Encephalitozoon hellem ATCC 50504]AFM97689.1 hypothetical protein EHEL_010660 [Encephalitozoon hellem ATCC 50504]KAG5858909.1 hypothetical protein KMI_10g16090 [Encephalitozoon hellem]UTX42380.1 hypothetical protein GPU96_01g00830 [Encephalitozoon hellem]WEL37822.1 hypothetical protein PFJ87_01g00760 [Encephalitozoon hellem]|eukprot:XP_003886670.1 hypothetical protein EHEL_010660 [Encephalitozoon hellem ATCC 50504]
MFFLFLGCVFSRTLFYLDESKEVESALRLNGQTVVLMQAKLFHRASSSHPWKEAEGISVGTKLSIYKSNGDYKSADPEPKNLIFKDVKHETSTTFFYTTPETGYYTIVFSLDTDVRGELALELAIYEGRPWTPEIVSGTDYQMEWLTRKMSDLLYVSKNNFDMQSLDDWDEVEYTGLYNSIFKLINRIVILKIATIFATLLYINRKTKEFYISKKIVKK